MGTISNPEIVAALTALRGVDGRINPERVVEAARDESSPLHEQFEWDDSEAAQRYRILQARELLRVTVTILPGTTTQIRAFVSLSDEDGYRSIGNVLVNSEQRAQLLEDALKDMRTFESKYKHLSEVADVIAVMKRSQQQRLAG